MSNAPVGYADETSTGRTQNSLQGLRRISIAARALPDANEFAWVEQLRHDFARQDGELKSDAALAICSVNPRARDFLVRNVTQTEIFVIDVFHDLYEIIRLVLKYAPDPRNAIDSLVHQLRIPRELLEDWLRDQKKLALLRSSFPIVQALLDQTGFVDENGDPVKLLDVDAICRLPSRQFSELVTRFTVAFAEAVDPRIRALSLQETMLGRTFGTSNYVAAKTLSLAIDHDIVFDRGGDKIVKLIQQANTTVANAVDAACVSSLVRRRSVDMGDSAEVRGIQAADLAAGYAATVFERVYDGNALSAARKLRDEFSRVLFNDRWLD